MAMVFNGRVAIGNPPAKGNALGARSDDRAPVPDFLRLPDKRGGGTTDQQRMIALRQIADFVRGIRIERRFGEVSRAPLKLLRFQLQGQRAELEWLARPADTWDSALPRPIREQNFSFQALQDAVALREMLFELLPEICEADLRAFRQSACEAPKLVIFGKVNREAPDVLRVTSPAMRAKLYGFHFQLHEGVLGPLEMQESDLQLMISE